MIGAWWSWPVAAGLYILFRLWYDNWRGPLRADEIERFMQVLGQSPGDTHSDMQVVRRFLEDDDGHEFLMSNLVGLRPGTLVHPQSGEPVSARALLEGYSRAFVLILLRYGGHPFIVTRKVGGYLDSWNVAEDPGWTISAFMRYRSRRDCMRLATHPRFLAAHPLKVLATAATQSFPTHVVMAGTLRPRAAVALLLALGAALIHLASLLT